MDVWVIIQRLIEAALDERDVSEDSRSVRLRHLSSPIALARCSAIHHERSITIRASHLIEMMLRQARAGYQALTGPQPLTETNGVPHDLTPLREVILTDEVSRTLFDDFHDHQVTERGHEETGWVLLGYREADRVTAIATLPAGGDRDAGEAHVRFNVEAQALASRIVRQHDKRLSLIGVVHTHPGRLRHPSRGDYDGDHVWVRNLRGREGIFGIGTVDDTAATDPPVAHQPRPNVLQLGRLRFDWYTLNPDDRWYRPIPIHMTLGPDLARSLRPVWQALERHAGSLDRLARQLARVRFEVLEGSDPPTLAVVVPLAEPGQAIRVLLTEDDVRFCLERHGEIYAADLPAGTAPDHGAYQMLAILAARPC